MLCLGMSSDLLAWLFVVAWLGTRGAGRMIAGEYADRFESSEGRGGGILGVERCEGSGKVVSIGVLGTLVAFKKPYCRGSRTGVDLAGSSCRGGAGRACGGSGDA